MMLVGADLVSALQAEDKATSTQGNHPVALRAPPLPGGELGSKAGGVCHSPPLEGCPQGGVVPLTFVLLAENLTLFVSLHRADTRSAPAKSPCKNKNNTRNILVQ